MLCGESMEEADETVSSRMPGLCEAESSPVNHNESLTSKSVLSLSNDQMYLPLEKIQAYTHKYLPHRATRDRLCDDAMDGGPRVSCYADANNL